MDKESKDPIGVNAAVNIRITKSPVPGKPDCYRGSVALRKTVGIEEIAQRLHDNSCGLKKETLLMSYRLMNGEIYNAMQDGYNVDFCLGRTEVTVGGSFTSVNDVFDPSRHTLTARLRPSPRLRQVVENLPVANVTRYYKTNGPKPELIYENGNKPSADASLPSKDYLTVFIRGRNLKLMGDLPGVGITLYCLDTEEEIFIPASEMAINQSDMLCFLLPDSLHAGEWEAIVATQFNPSYRLYKTIRTGTMGFTVLS